MSDRSTLRLLRAQPKPCVTMARLRQAVRLYRNGYGSREQRKRNMRAWLAAGASLGDKWLYAKPVKLERKT